MLTHEKLLELLHYNPATGIFTRRISAGRWHAGQVCGWKNSNGYIRLEIDDRRFYAHRLAWFYVNGQWPHRHLDHANRNREDNRICNLREATPSQNLGNSKGKSGRLKGTTRRGNGRWVAQLGAKYLGTFDTEWEAHLCYVAAANKAFGAFARSV
jgi:hypothetical protein